MRRFVLWGIGLVGGLAVIAGAWFFWQSPARVLAACGSEPLFTTALLDPNKLVTITPLGNISPPGHVTPTNHLYLNVKDGNEIRPELATPVYAPADLLITAIHRDLDARGGAESTNDYRIDAGVCKGVTIVLDHLNNLTPELTEVFEANKDDCDTHTVNSYQTITYCHASMRQKIAAGTQLGLAGGAAATGLDLGVYDRRKPKLKFANQSRYGSDEPYTVCGLDEFSEPLKSQLSSKLGRQSTRRTIEPRCGQIDQDVMGTAQGNWWTLDAGNSRGPEGWANSLSLIHDNVDPT